MNTSRLVRSSASVVLLTVGAVLSATPHKSNSSHLNRVTRSKQTRRRSMRMLIRIWTNRFQQSKDLTIRELGGDWKPRSPANSNRPISSLRLGRRLDELLQKIPDLISDEAVSQAQYAASQGIVPSCIGMDCLAAGRSSVWDDGFSYLILDASGSRRCW